MTTVRAALATLLALLSLVGLPSWIHLTSDVRPKPQTAPVSSAPWLGPVPPSSPQKPPMTEADARVLLRDCSGFGGLEAWLGGRLLRQGWLARAARVIA